MQLYNKARQDALEANEVAWLERQTTEHPWFGLTYMVLARHHAGNKSTIRDKMVLRGAAYSLNRRSLFNYLSGILQAPAADAPKEEDAVEARTGKPETESPEKQSEKLENSGEAPGKKAETPVTESPEDLEKPEKEPAAELDMPPREDKTETGVPPAEKTEPVAKTAEPVRSAPPSPEINWFLNMRLKLQVTKYAGMQGKLLKGLRKIGEAASGDGPSEKTEAEETPEKPAAKAPEGEEKQSPEQNPASGVVERIRAAKKKKGKAPPADDSEKRSYEIGAFSGFSFLGGGEAEDPGDSEIDSNAGTAESVTFHTGDDPEQDGNEIVFEEGDRIVEITVTREELEKYFKGKLPGESAYTPSISLDFDVPELEKKTADLARKVKEEEKAQPKKKPEADKARHADLIRRFIENEPGISRKGDYEGPADDLSKTGGDLPGEWVTETLAQIHAKQGNTAKAIRIYKQLSLLFPEKSDYFAVQISKLK